MKKELKQKAYTAEQFGKIFGKDGAWTRRQVHDGKLKAIRGWGEMMIPSSEMNRVMESAANNLRSVEKEGQANV